MEGGGPPSRDYNMGILGQDTTTFAFRHNPISEKILFLWKSPRHCLTLELKLKKFIPLLKMTTLKDFEDLSQGNVCDS